MKFLIGPKNALAVYFAVIYYQRQLYMIHIYIEIYNIHITITVNIVPFLAESVHFTLYSPNTPQCTSQVLSSTRTAASYSALRVALRISLRHLPPSGKRFPM